MNAANRTVVQALLNLQDQAYAAFQAKLMPTVDPALIIGVRTPDLRRLAKELKGTPEAKSFLKTLPHTYFDENQLHAFLISLEKSFEPCLSQVECFLPYIDNWATSDQLSPAIFKKHKQPLLPAIESWLQSDHPYTLRFGIGMLMRHFLDEDFDPKYPERLAQIRSEEYYVNMMLAWYFATALAKQYEAAVPYLEERKLDPWVHGKTIQKALESYRISAEKKEYLKSLR